MNNEQIFIDSFRGPKLHGNFILDLNPLSKLDFAFFSFMGAALLGRYWPRLTVILMCFLVNALAGKACFKRFVSLYSKVASILFLFLLLLNTAFQPGQTVYWSWWIIDVTKEGFLYGLAMALLITEICGAVMTFYITTPLKDLMYSVEMLGLPRTSSYIMLASMQSISDLGRSARTIMESQSARGVETQGSLSTRFKALIPVFFPLMLGAIAATEEKTVAMATRAFESKAKSTHIYELKKTSAAEKVFCIIFDLAVIAAVAWRFVR